MDGFRSPCLFGGGVQTIGTRAFYVWNSLFFSIVVVWSPEAESHGGMRFATTIACELLVGVWFNGAIYVDDMN